VKFISIKLKLSFDENELLQKYLSLFLILFISTIFINQIKKVKWQ